MHTHTHIAIEMDFFSLAEQTCSKPYLDYQSSIKPFVAGREASLV